MSRLDAAVAELVSALRDELKAESIERPDRLLTIPEVAERLAISRATVYAEMGGGRLRSIAIGRARRIPESAIAEYVAAAR